MDKKEKKKKQKLFKARCEYKRFLFLLNVANVTLTLIE